MLRHLRIAAAVFFALLAIGFVALWVRSNDYRLDHFYLRLGKGSIVGFTSYDGVLSGGGGARSQFSTGEYGISGDPTAAAGSYGFNFAAYSTHAVFSVPHWCAVVCCVFLSALSSFKRTWRISIRGMLIGTAVVAAILGIVAYSAR